MEPVALEVDDVESVSVGACSPGSMYWGMRGSEVQAVPDGDVHELPSVVAVCDVPLLEAEAGDSLGLPSVVVVGGVPLLEAG